VFSVNSRAGNKTSYWIGADQKEIKKATLLGVNPIKISALLSKRNIQQNSEEDMFRP
jgi:hypothetical protein